MLNRYSSRRQPLDAGFLNARLAGARRYDRIAGYFSSSILEVAGEALESVTGQIRVACNSGLTREDVDVARAAQAAMRREWCDSRPEQLGDAAKPRFARLYEWLRSGKIEIRVLPDDAFGLIHGKAGVVTLADGRHTSFLGSANETGAAFRLNYELIWEDDAPEAVAWVQEEFDALWSSPHAVRLADFVIQDLERLSRRELLGEVSRWREEPDPASVVVEAPIYRKEVGLWEHQKHFVKLAFDAHRGPHGARFVLADQVGLGKTLQLAMAAQLMALVGDGPVLVLAPKPLLQQWQDELDTLLGLPSAVWDGAPMGRRVRGVEHPGAPATSPSGAARAASASSPQGLITRGAEVWWSGLRTCASSALFWMKRIVPGGSAIQPGHAGRRASQIICCGSCGASRHARGVCCSPQPRPCSFIPLRRSTCWTRSRRVRIRCWGPRAAAGASRRLPSTCCWGMHSRPTDFPRALGLVAKSAAAAFGRGAVPDSTSFAVVVGRARLCPRRRGGPAAAGGPTAH